MVLGAQDELELPVFLLAMDSIRNGEIGPVISGTAAR